MAVCEHCWGRRVVHKSICGQEVSLTCLFCCGSGTQSEQEDGVPETIFDLLLRQEIGAAEEAASYTPCRGEVDIAQCVELVD